MSSSPGSRSKRKASTAPVFFPSSCSSFWNSVTSSYRLSNSFATMQCMLYFSIADNVFCSIILASVSSLKETQNAFGDHTSRHIFNIFGVDEKLANKLPLVSNAFDWILCDASSDQGM